MRRGAGSRVAFVPILALFLCSWLLLHRFRQERFPFFAAVVGPPIPPVPTTTPPTVEVVVASLKHEDTSWVRQHIPEWSRSIYIVNDPENALTVPKNKGHEAMVYMTHIIDRYETLAETTVFIHAARFAWHNDDPDYDAIATLRHLQLGYVQESGYVSLRCVWVLGCPAEIRPHADAADLGKGVAPKTTQEVYKQAFQELMPGVEVPEVVGVSCCSQFAVSRDAIRRRPREDYVRWRNWLLETPLTDSLSGRVFEYTWHIIFGKDSVYCPHAGDCYCKLYGLCDLPKCNDKKCEGRYELPPFSVLPVGWPRIGWSGEERSFSGPL
ncbi:hypothetical protein B0H67DRAFT_483041 [Lasiosphaeris hirsuta]|uniref:Uncharacterized protein n=1 Tax=Lasiosphaeris hirsuta TaxID=260670 RepID=A0AA40B072_9PEZI|nr:hypothetical protein B0H67DRAFT_483041 [Lasiosphaeris hirsuta]